MSESNPRPLIFGEVLFDHFPDGSVVLGGAPFNVAAHLQAFRLDPLLISRVGDDPLGRRIRDAMHARDMNAGGLQLDSAHPTGTVRIRIEDGEPSYDIVPDQAYDFVDTACLPPLHAGASLLYHGSLGLRNAAARTALATLKRTHRPPIFMDVNLRDPWWDAAEVRAQMAEADWVKLNHHELAELGPAADDADQQARQLLADCGLQALFVTYGGAGAKAYAADGATRAVRPEAELEVVDTVGAGDAFASVLILGLLSDWPLQITLDRAQAFASAMVQQRGATVEDPAFYKPYLCWKTL